MPSKSHADFVCSNFAILDFFKTDIAALPLPVKTPTTCALRRYGPDSGFTCVIHLDCWFNFAIKIILNIF